MTPAQKTALETVAGRALTDAEVTALDPLLDPNNRNDVEIARIISNGRVKYEPTQIGPGTIIAVMGDAGGQFLDDVTALGQSDRNVYWGMDAVRRGAFDLSVPLARGMLAALQTKLPAHAQNLSKLLAAFAQPDNVPVNSVSDALNKAEGRMTL